MMRAAVNENFQAAPARHLPAALGLVYTFHVKNSV
jgi:hypothetical protein